MSNMTKTIAILGVVAGLGVAALPLSTYAADPDAVEWKSEGAGTGDPMTATESYGTDADGKNWVKTSTEIKLNVPDSLSIDASADEVTLTDANGKGQYTEADGVDVQVISRNQKGYTLTMVGSGTGTPTTDLVNGTFKIPTGAIADITAFDASTGASAWGYRLTADAGNVTADAANAYKAVSATAAGGVIDTTTEASDVTYNIAFGAVVAAGQATGDYVGEVTFIATNNQ